MGKVVPPSAVAVGVGGHHRIEGREEHPLSPASHPRRLVSCSPVSPFLFFLFFLFLSAVGDHRNEAAPDLSRPLKGHIPVIFLLLTILTYGVGFFSFHLKLSSISRILS